MLLSENLEYTNSFPFFIKFTFLNTKKQKGFRLNIEKNAASNPFKSNIMQMKTNL